MKLRFRHKHHIATVFIIWHKSNSEGTGKPPHTVYPASENSTLTIIAAIVSLGRKVSPDE